MHRAWMIAYPWDITDDDLSAVLDRLHGETGITGLSLFVATPAITQLRVRDIEPRIFRTRGGLFFHPSDERYGVTRCKPIVSSKLKSRDPIAKIVGACAQRSLDLSLIISAALTGRMTQRHPEMACKNIFDDVSQLSLCLTNPDVQSYLCSLVSDVSSQYNPTAVIIKDFICAWMEAYHTELHTASPFSDPERTLLATCFCESCHQRATQAGVDVDMARRSVKVMLQNSFEQGSATDISFDRILADNAPLSTYNQWRGNELSALLKRIVDACSCEILLDRSVCDSSIKSHTTLDLNVPNGVIERLDRPDQLESVFQTGASRHELLIPHTLTMGSHAPELISLLSRAVESGCRGAYFHHYGLLPQEAMTTIKQALRFARRINED